MRGKVHSIVICNNEDEALERGHKMKIYDGEHWFLGILWKTQEMIGTERFNCIRFEDGE